MAVMEGNGAYNKHAQPQAAGAAMATPFLQRAVEKITLESGDQPVIIADYGSSQGKNSLAPIGSAIRNLGPRIGPNRPICVFHIDQPSNDFSSRRMGLSNGSSWKTMGSLCFPM